MDSTIYDGSPLAHYLEGHYPRKLCHSYKLTPTGHGEAQPGVEHIHDHDTSSDSENPVFAPRGPPESARKRMQRVLTKPLHLNLHRRTQTWDSLQDACAVSSGDIDDKAVLIDSLYSLQ